MSDRETPGGLWADIWQSSDRKWCMAVGMHDKKGTRIVLDRKTGMRTEHNATTAMEAAWQFWLKTESLEDK